MTPYTLDEAEADLRAALNRGDADAIASLEPVVDRLDVRPEPPSTLAAALWYAEQGIKVFPLAAGSKLPHKGTHGCKDASGDPDTIRAWWQRWPNSNVAIATGFVVDVVDIDGRQGQASRAEHWEDVFARIDADALGKVLTPRAGGMHIYVPVTGRGNGTNIAPGVDFRGAGGYVVAPPSRTPDGSYRWLGEPRLTGTAAAA